MNNKNFSFQAKYNKDYTSSAKTKGYAQYYYTYNKKIIDRHNSLYDCGLRTYRLAVNQFTDMRFIHFSALFPVTAAPGPSNAELLPEVQPAPLRYDPITDFGNTSNIENQGTKCNSGCGLILLSRL